MAKWNEIRSLFGGLNAGNPRGRKDVALGYLIFGNQIEGFAPKPDFSRRNRCPGIERFVRNIDHLCAAVGADMRETLHRSAADCDHFAAWLVIVAKIVLLRLSVDNVEEKVLELLVTRAGPKWFHNVELEITAKTRT